jgi:hypothetical protein
MPMRHKTKEKGEDKVKEKEKGEVVEFEYKHDEGKEAERKIEVEKKGHPTDEKKVEKKAARVKS